MFTPGAYPAGGQRPDRAQAILATSGQQRIHPASLRIREPLERPAKQLPAAPSESEPGMGRPAGNGSGARNATSAAGRPGPALSPPTHVLPSLLTGAHVPAGPDNNNGAQHGSAKVRPERQGDENNNGAGGFAIKTLSSRAKVEGQPDRRAAGRQPLQRPALPARPHQSGRPVSPGWSEIREAIIVIDNKLCKRLLNQRATGKIGRARISIVPSELAGHFRARHQDIRPQRQLNAPRPTMSNSARAPLPARALASNGACRPLVLVCTSTSGKTNTNGQAREAGQTCILCSCSAGQEELRKRLPSLDMNADHSGGFIVLQPELGTSQGPCLAACLNEAIKVASSYSDTPLEYVASLAEDSPACSIGLPLNYSPSEPSARIQFTICPSALELLNAFPGRLVGHQPPANWPPTAHGQVHRFKRSPTPNNLLTPSSRTRLRHRASEHLSQSRQISSHPSNLSPAHRPIGLIRSSSFQHQPIDASTLSPVQLRPRYRRALAPAGLTTHTDQFNHTSRSRQGCALFDDKSYVIYSSLGSFYIPMLIMVFFYYRIYRVASRAQKALQRGYMTTKWPPSCAKRPKQNTVDAAHPKDPTTCQLVAAGKCDQSSAATCNGALHLPCQHQDSSSPAQTHDESRQNAYSISSNAKGSVPLPVSTGGNSCGERVTLRIHRREKSPIVSHDDSVNSNSLQQQAQSQTNFAQHLGSAQQPRGLDPALRRTTSTVRKLDAQTKISTSSKADIQKAPDPQETPIATPGEPTQVDSQVVEKAGEVLDMCPDKSTTLEPSSPGLDKAPEDKRKRHHKHHHHHRCRCRQDQSEREERKKCRKYHRCRHHRCKSHAQDRATSSVQITVSNYDAEIGPLDNAESSKLELDESATEQSNRPRVDRSQSCQPASLMTLDWISGRSDKPGGSTTDQAQEADDRLSDKPTEGGSVETGRSVSAADGSQASGLSLVANIPSQVRKQSMILLSCLTSRSSQTLRRLSMVASHPVDSLLNRARSRDDNQTSSSPDNEQQSTVESDSSANAIGPDGSVIATSIDRSGQLSGNASETGAPGTVGRKGRRRRHAKSRRRRRGASSKRTLDDYLMAVAGIDGSSSDEELTTFEGQSMDEDDEDEDDQDQTRRLKRQARVLTPLLIQSTSAALLATACKTTDEPNLGQSFDQAGQMEKTDGALAGATIDSPANQSIEPSEPQVEGRLRRQGGLYERATSRAGADSGEPGKVGKPGGRSESPAARLPINPLKGYLCRALGRAKGARADKMSPIEIRLDVASRHIKLNAANSPAQLTTGRRRGAKSASRWHAKRLRAETKAAKTVAIIVGGFIFCWLPFFTAYLSRSILCASPDCIPQSLLSLFTWLGYLNSAINPVIYGLFSADFRLAFKNILCRCRFRGNDDTVVVSVLVDSIIKSIL